MTVEQRPAFLENVLDWLHKGYPEGVPRTDYYPLLALLKRSLSEDEIVQAAQSILRASDFETPVTEDQIREAIREVTAKDPTPEELKIGRASCRERV